MVKAKPKGGREPAPIKFPATASLAKPWARVVEIAVRLPAVAESASYGTPALKVAGKFMARLRTEAEGGLAICCDLVDRHMLMQADPETFYITDHYTDYPMVLVNLANVRWAAMPQLIEQAWRLTATARMVEAFDAG